MVLASYHRPEPVRAEKCGLSMVCEGCIDTIQGGCENPAAEA